MRYYSFAQADDVLANFVIRNRRPPQLLRARYAACGSTPPTAPRRLMISKRSSRWYLRHLPAGVSIVDMLAAFAGLALLLALVGIYGLISYVTTQRTGEVAIRMALGAQRFDILSLVLSSVLGWIATGLTIGAVLSFIACAFLRNLFAAFGAGILSALGAAVVILVIVGVIATVLPAYRAASIQPVEALRNE